MTDTKRPLAILITMLSTLTAFMTGCSGTDATETKSQETISAEEKMEVSLTGKNCRYSLRTMRQFITGERIDYMDYF